MSERSSVLATTERLETAVRVLQTGIALFLVIVLVVGLVNLVATFVRATLAVELLGFQNAVSLISTTIEMVLYLFIVIELFRTVVAYLEAKSVVRAVIHAGLIAVVRQIMVFDPGDVGTPTEALLTAGAHVILLVGLLLGFYLVHRPEALE